MLGGVLRAGCVLGGCVLLDGCEWSTFDSLFLLSSAFLCWNLTFRGICPNGTYNNGLKLTTTKESMLIVLITTTFVHKIDKSLRWSYYLTCDWIKICQTNLHSFCI